MSRDIRAWMLAASLAACSTQNAVVPQSTSPLTIDVTHALPSAQSVVVQFDGKTLAGSAVRKGYAAIATSAPSGRDTFTIVAYDGVNGSGNVLASGELHAILQPGVAAVLHVALTGRAASLSIALENPYPPAGTPVTQRVEITLLDADGNTIVGSYASSARLLDSDTSGATRLSTTTVSSSQQRVELVYNGATLSQATITASAARVSRVHADLVPIPTVVEQLPAPTVHGLPEVFADLCIGPDGNLWITGSSIGSIEKLSADGKFVVYPIARETGPAGISTGSDGNLWFAETNAGAIAKMTTSGHVTTYPVPTGPSQSSQPSWTTPGPDGRTWFVDQGIDVAGAITSGGTITEYPLPKQSFPQQLVTGPDGNLWITDIGLNAVDVVSTAGKIVAIHPLKKAGADPWGIAVGPDKNLWIAEYGANAIGRMTPNGALEEFTVPTSLGGPLNVTAGPDGNVWFAETGGGIAVAGKIGYISTDGSVVRDFPIPGNTFHVHNLVFDAHKSLWFTEFELVQSALGKLVY
jgi:streptogramin lyase